jgi:hypothetical protein
MVHNPATARDSVRIAVLDLPTAIWDDRVEAIAKWWSAHRRGGIQNRSHLGLAES